MQKRELLAPAGSIDAGYAALYYGADAVYLGLKRFSARATAENFSPEELNEFTAYAHHLKRKVYVTINTLIREDEIAGVLESLNVCSDCRVDGIIVQDLGVAGIIREKYPELELHASTQMAVHNKEGAVALQKFGFKRVVLARELTLSEIREIAEIPGLETEAFIHGALCYSYSGLCLFSALEYDKSANRGQCLYPCRAVFDGEEGKAHYFSMKDMALQDDVLKMPVTSLKIEGRKKSALYVAAVTDYYRQILDGRGRSEIKEENIRQIFSRPWCKFHFNGRNKEVIDRTFVGHRGLSVGKILSYDGRSITFKTGHKIARHDGIQLDVPGMEKPYGFSLLKLKIKNKDVFEADKGERVEIILPPGHPALDLGTEVYLASSSAVKGAYDYDKPKPGLYKQREPLFVEVEIQPQELIARAKKAKYQLEGNFMPAQNPEKTTEAAEKSFAKTGDTDFELAGIKIINPKGLFVPVSLLNELRRGLYADLQPEQKTALLPDNLPITHGEKSNYLLKIDSPAYLEKINQDMFTEIVFLLSLETSLKDLAGISQKKLRLALPAVCRNTALWRQKIAEFSAAGYTKWEIANYWGLSVLPKGVDISFDTPLYMFNSQAVLQAKKLGASRVCLPTELSSEYAVQMMKQACLPICLVARQDVPLFTSAVCIRGNSCAQCDKKEKRFELKKDGKMYDVLSRDCQTMLFNREPRQIKAFCQADYIRFDFCYQSYSPEQIAAFVAEITG